jgi:superfamily II DNA or RNA helicase
MNRPEGDSEARWTLRVEPRTWQRRALAIWESNYRRGIVEVVTGAGKTVFAEMCMINVQQALPNVSFVIVVPTLALLDQWYVSLQEELGVRPNDIGTYSGEGKPKTPRRINLMTLNTARDFAPRVVAGKPVCLIVDECHRIGSPMNALALQGEHLATLGMSATPEREYDQAFDQIVAPNLGPIVFRYDYNQARADGVITPFTLINVAIEFQEDERQQYEDLTKRLATLMGKRRGGFDVEDQLVRLLRRRAAVSAAAIMRIPVAISLTDRHRGDRLLIFHESIRAAEVIRDRLVERGHNVGLYHSRIGPIIRRDNLRLFRRGIFDVLVSCRALDEGVNIPETTVAILASSTASGRQRIQRLGRVLRPAQGKDRAIVYTLYATEVEQQRLSAEAEALSSADSVEWMASSVGPRG